MMRPRSGDGGRQPCQGHPVLVSWLAAVYVAGIGPAAGVVASAMAGNSMPFRDIDPLVAALNGLGLLSPLVARLSGAWQDGGLWLQARSQAAWSAAAAAFLATLAASLGAVLGTAMGSVGPGTAWSAALGMSAVALWTLLLCVLPIRGATGLWVLARGLPVRGGAMGWALPLPARGTPTA